MNQFEKLTKYEIIENYPEYRLYIKKDDYNEIYSLNNALKKSASQKSTQRGSISIKFSENDILYKLPFKSYVLISSNSDYANIGTFKIGSKITLTYKKNTSNSIEKTTTLTCSSGENNYIINVDNSSSTIISGGGIGGNTGGNSGGNSGGNTGGSGYLNVSISGSKYTIYDKMIFLAGNDDGYSNITFNISASSLTNWYISLTNTAQMISLSSGMLSGTGNSTVTFSSKKFDMDFSSPSDTGKIKIYDSNGRHIYIYTISLLHFGNENSSPCVIQSPSGNIDVGSSVDLIWKFPKTMTDNITKPTVEINSGFYDSQSITQKTSMQLTDDEAYTQIFSIKGISAGNKYVNFWYSCYGTLSQENHKVYQHYYTVTGNTAQRIFTVELSGIDTSENSGNIINKTRRLETTQYKIFSTNSSITPIIDVHIENIDINVISVNGFNSFRSGDKITSKTYVETISLSPGKKCNLTLSDYDLYRTFMLEITYVDPYRMNVGYDNEVTFGEESYFNLTFDSNYVGNDYYFAWHFRAGTLIQPSGLSDGVKQQITKTQYSFKYNYINNEETTRNGGAFKLYNGDDVIYERHVFITLHAYEPPEGYYVDFTLVDASESELNRTSRVINNQLYLTLEKSLDLTKESTHRVKINTNIPGGSISVLRFGSEAGRLYIKYPGSSSFETSNSFYDIPISYLDGEQIFEIKLTPQDANYAYIPFYTLINYNENHVYDALVFVNNHE